MIKVDYIIRTIGERTEEVCIELVNMQCQPGEEVSIIRDATSLSQAVEKTLKTGLGSSADWVVAIDSDMLFLPGGLAQIRKELASCSDEVFRTKSAVFDKLFRIKRDGVNGYRRSMIEDMYAAYEEIKDQPNLKMEKATQKRFREKNKNLVIKEFKTTVAIHDFYQYYKDLYRKAYLYSIRSSNRNREVKRLWEVYASKDPDYLVMLTALDDATTERRQLANSVKDFSSDELDEKLRELGLMEKTSLVWNNFVETSLVISMNAEIHSHEENGVFKDFFPSAEPSLINKFKALLIKLFPDSLHEQYLRTKAYIKKK